MRLFRTPHWALTLAFSVLVFVAATIIATPLLLSSSAVRGGVTQHLSRATGHPVQLRGEPSVTLRPYLGVIYRDVVVGPPQQPVMTADEMQVSLQVLSALWGQTRVSEVRLVRPAFDLKNGPDGPNWLTAQSPVTQALAREDDANSNASLLRVDIRDGALRYASDDDEPTIELGNLNGSIEWPRLSASADIALKAVWNGENISLDASFTDPLALMRGDTSDLTFAASGSLGSLGFSGNMNLVDDGTNVEEAGGRLSFTTPATRQLGRWLNQNDAVVWPALQMAAEGELVWRGNTIQLNDAELSVADQPSTGRLDIMLNGKAKPKVSGTLAFTQIELPALNGDVDGLAARMTDLARHSPITLDLRLSASQATTSQLAIGDVAAGLIVRESILQLDLAQGALNGGQVSGTITAEFAEDESSKLAAELRLENGDLSALTPLFGQSAFQLTGEGDATLEAFSTSASAEAPYSRITLAVQGGALEGMSLPNLASALGSNEGVAEDVLTGSTALDSLDTTLFLRDGLLVLRDAQVISAGTVLTLSGRSVLDRASLALRGELTEGDEQSSAFFVGGTLDRPLIVPFSTATGQTGEEPPTR